MTAPIMSRFDLFFVVLDECREDTDISIGTHILNLHRHKSLALEPPFSADQLQKYIRYARTLKPQFTKESALLLVERYKALRQNDATGYGSSYRMTVRQLESIIRLSEALARLHCDTEVKVKYVREACRLLVNSIIRVENEDVEIEQTLMDEQGDEEEMETEENAETHKPSKIKFDDYMKISKMLTYHLGKADTGNEEDMGNNMTLV
jgi:DNA replication licensing factor MCM6